MHEKLIFIDDDVLWSGSLNPLSFRNTQEVMERRVSPQVVQDYVRLLRVNELVGGYADGRPACPYCGAEVIADEGSKEPFYWRCVEKGCYTRSVMDAPFDGDTIRCRKCDGDVEVGEWGGKPAWRCRRNRKHHQKIVRSHLRSSQVRKQIPKQKLTELDRLFGMSTSEKTSRSRSVSIQPMLFDRDV